MAEYIELKPCPFCGRKPYLITKDHEEFPHPWHMIMCDYSNGGCGAESAWCHDERIAIKMWNMRVKEDGN